MKQTFRVGSIITCLLGIASFSSGASSPATDTDQQANHHPSGTIAKITMRDGAVRTAKLEGVGCTQSICSRTAIKAKSESDSLVRTWFDSLAAIEETTSHDALFVMNDGTSRRLSLLTDFRVLYLADRLAGPVKLDLESIKSVEFVTPTGSK
jgi:hypothetical protein